MERKLIHEKCTGCSRVRQDSTCTTYPNPEIWWNRGSCPLADHLKKKTEKGEKIRVGQQKQKKRKK